MKILYILVCLVLLISCGKGEITALDLPFEEEVTFTDGELTLTGVLYFDGEKMTFSPDSPEGYKVSITKDGGIVEYDGIVFSENVLPSSRFLPLFEILKGECEGIVISENPLSVEKKNIKITFNKDK
ncbi:MAG: hypothetical protein IJ323_05105 [Clostridia bacterium]|nr:hypothetical protein [Clostridia bacterium]MBQ7897786.1 hypothetical protein [Clostridia bacterium]